MRKKIFWILCLTLSGLFLISCLLIYSLFRSALFSEIQQQQTNLQKYNETIFTSYIDSFNMVPFQLVNDEEIGSLLNTDSDKYLDMFLAREALRKKFSTYLKQQLFSANLDCRFLLYLNGGFPLSAYCDSYPIPEHIQSRTSQVYSSRSVSSQEWYQRAMQSSWSPYFFLQKQTHELCYALRVQNYALDNSSPESMGVVVIAIPETSFVEKLSIDALTPSGSVLLSNKYGDILFSHGAVSTLPFSLKDGQKAPNALQIGREHYMVNTASVQNDLFLTLLTPYSDIEIMVQQSMRIYLLFACLFFPFLIAILYLIACRITAPIISLARLIGSIDDTRSFDTEQLGRWKDAELRILCRSFSSLVQKENAMIDRILEESKARRAAVLQALQAQINPHFLYNALDIVSWMALDKQEDTIADIVSSISNLMHYGISQPDAVVLIQQELDNIREYIRICRLERPCRIHLEVEADAGLLSQLKIPKFTLQPLVENVIHHNPDAQSLSVTVSVYPSGPAVIIAVTDTGAGADCSKLNDYLLGKPTDLRVSNGFGIRNVNERLRLHYGVGSGLSYSKTSEGFLRAVVKIYR